jgi:hypothetical protein
MKEQMFTKWYVKYVLFALALILLVIVPLFKGGPVGSDPFLIERLASDVGFYDGLSFGGKVAVYNWGTPLIVRVAPFFLMSILPLILGLLSFLLFRLIIKEITPSLLVRNVASFLFIISPLFIYTFSFMNFLVIPLFLSLAAFYFFVNGKYKYLTVPICLVLPFFSMILTTSLLVILFFYTLFERKERLNLFLTSAFGAFMTSVAYYGLAFYSAGFPISSIVKDYSSFLFLQRFVFEFGSFMGVSLFLFILAFVGVLVNWDKKYDNLFGFFSICFLFVFSLFREENLVFLIFFVVLLATVGLLQLMKRKWTSKSFRKATLFIIIFGLLFASFSTIDKTLDVSPNDAMMQGLNFLEDQPQGVVFSHYSRGVWFNSIGHRSVVDEHFLFVEDAQDRFEDMNTLLYSRDFEVSLEIIEEYNIDYIWIDEEIYEDIWEYDTQGLLFITQYSKDFNKIYDKKGVEVWKFRR